MEVLYARTACHEDSARRCHLPPCRLPPAAGTCLISLPRSLTRGKGEAASTRWRGCLRSESTRGCSSGVVPLGALAGAGLPGNPALGRSKMNTPAPGGRADGSMVMPPLPWNWATASGSPRLAGYPWQAALSGAPAIGGMTAAGQASGAVPCDRRSRQAPGRPGQGRMLPAGEHRRDRAKRGDPHARGTGSAQPSRSRAASSVRERTPSLA
jgi:hypothetical protein